MHLNSPDTQLFFQLIVYANMKESSKLRITDLRKGNQPVTARFPSHRASNAENISMAWRHNVEFCPMKARR